MNNEYIGNKGLKRWIELLLGLSQTKQELMEEFNLTREQLEKLMEGDEEMDLSGIEEKLNKITDISLKMQSEIEKLPGIVESRGNTFDVYQWYMIDDTGGNVYRDNATDANDINNKYIIDKNSFTVSFAVNVPEDITVSAIVSVPNGYVTNVYLNGASAGGVGSTSGSSSSTQTIPLKLTKGTNTLVLTRSGNVSSKGYIQLPSFAM